MPNSGWCVDDALMMHSCDVDALMMQWWCAGDALMTHWWCIECPAFDVLEPAAFQKYRTCWAVSALCLCLWLCLCLFLSLSFIFSKLISYALLFIQMQCSIQQVSLYAWTLSSLKFSPAFVFVFVCVFVFVFVCYFSGMLPWSYQNRIYTVCLVLDII